MKENKNVKNAPKIVFWMSFFVIVFAFIAIMSDSLGFTLPVLVAVSKNSSLRYFTYKQPLYENSTLGLSTSTVISTYHTNSPKNITTTVVSNMTTTRDFETQTDKNMKTHVAFLKVHKAGSTTMQNLFFRFGLRHNLNILLPKSGNYLNSPSQKLRIKPGEHYDIFACHTVYRTEWFKSLLPTDAVNIAIVREPVERMISSAFYYRDVFGVKYLKRIPAANFIHNLVNFPAKYNTAFFSQTRNSMGKDFGFPVGIQTNSMTRIKAYLDKLNSEFSLVMIMEKFDESLVMMKRILNWSFIDIIYLKTNSHKHNPIVLNKTEIQKFRQTSFLDYEIYEYFSKVFETKLKTIGSDFYDEVKFFQDVLDRVHEFCSTKEKREPSISISRSKWDHKFDVNVTDCEWMNTGEIRFINKLRSDAMKQQA